MSSARLLRLPRTLRVDWTRVATRWLPFADAATAELPLGRLARLALFQVSVGMVGVLMVGTLNRVMIVEIGVGAWLVALMVALPLLVSPFRALIGWKSDRHRSALGWRRVPYIWMGSGLQFAGLAIMPFAIVLLSGDTPVQLWAGHLSAALAFLLAGAGAQTVQTAGLALATDLSSERNRPRVVALMYLMLLLGMVGFGLLFSVALSDYSPTRLVQVVQGTAVATLVLNAVAVWKQEARNRERARAPVETVSFRSQWARFAQGRRMPRFLLAVGLGTAAFNMQDVILEPYGGEVLGLAVGQTTLLTGIMALGALAAFGLAAHRLDRGDDPQRLAAGGALLGLLAFSLVIFSGPLDSAAIFRAGVMLIGFGGGLFSVGTLSAAMGLHSGDLNGMVVGAYSGVVALASGLSIAMGGVLRDAVSALATAGALGEAMDTVAAGYSVVYHLELALLLATLAALGPLVRTARHAVGRAGQGPVDASTAAAPAQPHDPTFEPTPPPVPDSGAEPSRRRFGLAELPH